MKKGWKVALGILILGAISYVFATLYANHKINEYLTNELLKTEVEVKSVRTNLLMGTVALEGWMAVGKNKQNSRINNFEVKGISYYQLLVNDQIDIDELRIANFEIYLPLDQVSKSSNDRKVSIKQIVLENGTISNHKSDTLQSKISRLDLDVTDVNFNSGNVRKSLEYQINSIRLDSLFVRMNDFENLNTKGIEINKNEISIADLSIKTNKEKSASISRDEVNKDQMSLTISRIMIKDYGLKLLPEIKFTAETVSIDSSKFLIKANNNLIRTETVPMYAELMRTSKIKWNIGQIKINDALVSYSEPNSKNTKRGAITFNKINASLTNFHNLEGNGAIKMHTAATFMNSTRFQTDFSMDPYDKEDSFQWSGSLPTFELPNMNSFVYPVFNIKLKGIVNQYYFNIYGDRNTYNVDIKIKYDAAKIDFFNQKENRKTLLSGLTNLLATNDSEGKLIDQHSTSPRNTKASFFNQVWVIQRKALIKVFKYE